MFSNYFKIGWRNLLKDKVTGFINITGLAIGMAVAMLIGLWMYDELSFNKYHQNYERLVQVYLNQTFNESTGTSRAISIPMAGALRQQYGSDFKDIALTSWNFEHIVANGETKLLRNGMYVEPQFLEMFTLDMLSGTYEDALKDPNSIILSETLAQTLFGDEDPTGKTIRFDAKSDLQVTGVFKDLPYNTALRTVKCLIPWSYYLADQAWVRNAQDRWGNHSFQLYAQIADMVDIEALSAKIRDVEKVNNKNGNPEAFLFPMKRWHLFSEFKEGVNTGGRIQFVWLFGIVGVFVLLLACINFMNLSTARSEKRAKEVGIRKTVGSHRGQLVHQFLTESLLVTLIATILSVVLVQINLGWFNQLADKQVAAPWGQPLFWSLLLGFSVLTGVIAGSYPAFYLSSFKPLTVLKGVHKSGRYASVPRKVLVTVQFTVSIALIIGTLVVFNQIRHAKNRPVGYDRDSVMQFYTNPELEGKFETLRTDMLATQVVESVSTSSGPVTEIWSNQIGFSWEGMDPNSLPIFGTVAVTHEFGKTIGWNIKEGRDFSREFATDTAALILNESGVKLTGLQDIVGKIIRWNDEPMTVIGVVEDMIMESPWTPIKPTVFFVNPDWASVVTVKLTKDVPVQTAIAKIETVFKRHSPGSPFDYKFTDDEYEEKFRAEERIGKLARVFAILAICISCLGLFGLSNYVAEQRTKELGIRKVLGASIANLWAMQSKGFIGLVVLSCLIASPLAWYLLDGWLSQYEYRITLDASIFFIAAILALLVTMITVSFQSIRAAQANPVESLRSE